MNKFPDVSAAPDLKKFLKELSENVEQHVLLQQAWDPLTNLPNDWALKAALRRANNLPPDFWIAFVEVNKFKSINDEFGYSSADDLLRRLGEQLQKEEKWSPGLRAYRAHGDEFYLLGQLANGDADTSARLASQLKLMQEGIAGLQVGAFLGKEPAVMTCTVSVAWLTAGYLLRPPPELSSMVVTETEIRRCLESAMAFAKRADKPVVFDWTMLGREPVSIRGTCSSCGGKYTLSVEKSAHDATKKVWCPNCGKKSARPPVAGHSVVPMSTRPATS